MSTTKNMIGSGNVRLHVKAADREELFRILAETASNLSAAKAHGLSAEQIRTALEEREKQSSTAVGGGIVFPHARIKGISHLIPVIATIADGIKYETPDDEPVRIACMLLIPESQPMDGLRFFSAFAKCLQDKLFSETLRETEKSEVAVLLLGRVPFNDTEPLRASDIMTPFRCNATPEMPLRDATSMMMRFNADIVPVLDGRKLVGEISCSELFKLGIPDFFSHLKSVGFIRFFDPFEKYFSVEANSLVKDVMHKPGAVFPPDATLIEIVFAISVEHCPVAYIVSAEGDLLGIINQTLLLERIINL